MRSHREYHAHPNNKEKLHDQQNSNFCWAPQRAKVTRQPGKLIYKEWHASPRRNWTKKTVIFDRAWYQKAVITNAGIRK
jgi:hypothetical protein